MFPLTMQTNLAAANNYNMIEFNAVSQATECMLSSKPE